MTIPFIEILIDSKWKTDTKTHWKQLLGRHNKYMNNPEEKKKRHIPPKISAGKLRPANKHKKTRIEVVNPILKGMD